MTTSHAALIALALSTDDLDELARILRELARILRELIRGGDDSSARALARTMVDAGASWTIEDAEGVAWPVYHAQHEDWLFDHREQARWVCVGGVRLPSPTPWGPERERLFTCDLASVLLPLFEAAYPDDARPRDAIEAARRFVSGDVKGGELESARQAAEDAAEDVAADECNDAARLAALVARVAATYRWARVSMLGWLGTLLTVEALGEDAGSDTVKACFLRQHLG